MNPNEEQATHLVELHKHEDGYEVHEGGVELEGNVGGADVVGAGHDALHAQGQPHGEVEPVLAGNPILLLVDPFVLLKKRLELELLEEHDAHEEKPEDTVAKVTKHMVEVTHKTQGFSEKKNP